MWLREKREKRPRAHNLLPFPMEVPYSSSGALSRAHYALVRKVELAQTVQQADGYLYEELAVIRARLSRPGFSSVGL